MYSIVLFFALCIVTSLYIGALRELREQEAWGSRMYQMLPEQQKRRLAEDFETEQWVKSRGNQ